MAWIETIHETDADGELKEIYDEIMGARGKMSNIMRVHSLNPEAMKRHMDFYLTIMFGRSGLRRAERELIGTVVSVANECPYCKHHHAEALNFYWKDDDRIRRLLDDYHAADLSPRELAIATFSDELTREPGAASEQKTAVLREHGLSDKDILDATLITGYFNFVNRVALGLGVEFSEEEMQGFNY